MIIITHKKNAQPTKLGDLPDEQSTAFATKMNKTPVLYVPYRRSDNELVFAIVMIRPEDLRFVKSNGREFSTMKNLKALYPNEELVDVTIEI